MLDPKRPIREADIGRPTRKEGVGTQFCKISGHASLPPAPENFKFYEEWPEACFDHPGVSADLTSKHTGMNVGAVLAQPTKRVGF